MPELPEVETIKTQLEKLIVGKKVEKVEVGLPRMVKLSLDKFRRIVVGSRIKSIKRRAKILIFELSNGWSMLVHLKLSGRLIFRRKGEALKDEDTKWNHLIYHFSDGSRLFHNDLRQFGYVKLIETVQLTDFFKKEKLGPEPLSRNFDISIFRNLISKSKAKIKQFLMDQRNIAGIGNIYSDEILWEAKIHPFKKANELTVNELKSLYSAMRKILQKAVKLRGTSIRDYRDTEGKSGKYTEVRYVYQREGEPCPRCGTKIKKVKIGGRSAHFCPACQRLKP